MTRILSLWDAIVKSAAVIGIVVIAIGLMVRMIDARRALAKIGTALGTLLLLLALPPILVGIWHTLSFWQQVGIITLGAVVGAIALRLSTASKRNQHQ